MTCTALEHHTAPLHTLKACPLCTPVSQQYSITQPLCTLFFALTQGATGSHIAGPRLNGTDFVHSRRGLHISRTPNWLCWGLMLWTASSCQTQCGWVVVLLPTVTERWPAHRCTAAFVHLSRVHLGCKQPAIVGSLNLIDSCKASLAQEPAGSKRSRLNGCCRIARPRRSAAHLRFRNRRGGSPSADAASTTSGQACGVQQCRSRLCQRGVPDRHHPVLTTICRLLLGSDASLLLLFAISNYGDIKDGRWPPCGYS